MIFSIPTQPCPHCGYPAEEIEGADDYEGRPAPDDILTCCSCSIPFSIDASGRFYALTVEDFDLLVDDDADRFETEVVQALALLWFELYVARHFFSFWFNAREEITRGHFPP